MMVSHLLASRRPPGISAERHRDHRCAVARRVPCRSHEAGFTLLEVLLALALTAMLMSMLTAGVYGVMRDWDDSATALEQSLDQTVAVLQIERALQGAFPHSYQDTETQGRHVYFIGASDELAWVSSVSPGRAPGLMAWQLGNGRDGVHLRLAPAMADNPAERLLAAEERLLLENYRILFRYLLEDTEGARRWIDTWPGPEVNALPRAVHVTLSPLTGSASPLEIVAPVIVHQHRYLSPNEWVVQ